MMKMIIKEKMKIIKNFINFNIYFNKNFIKY